MEYIEEYEDVVIHHPAIEAYDEHKKVLKKREFKARDGEVFPTEKECEIHEKALDWDEFNKFIAEHTVKYINIVYDGDTYRQVLKLTEEDIKYIQQFYKNYSYYKGTRYYFYVPQVFDDGLYCYGHDFVEDYNDADRDTYHLCGVNKMKNDLKKIYDKLSNIQLFRELITR